MPRKRPGTVRRVRVLLADDHELVRRGIRGLLQSKRKWLVVGEAADGLEAVEKARKLQPDIVILDIDMPGLNGLEATPRIKQAAPAAKIIVLTLHESGEMIRRALDAGAYGLVLKSDLADRLLTALAEVATAKPFLTPKASALAVREFAKPESSKKAAGGSQKRPTSREVEVIRLLAQGKANKEIAAAMEISVRTAEAHRANIMKKLGVRSLAGLIHYALRSGITSVESSGSATLPK